MVQLKTLIATAVISALGGAFASQAFWFAPVTTELPENSTGHTDSLAQHTIEQLQQENQRLKKTLAMHLAQTTKQPTTNNATTTATTTPVTTTNTSTTEQQLQTQLQQLEMEKQLGKATDFNNWMLQAQEENPDFNLNQTLAQNFNNETRDPVWADAQENHYRDLFIDSAELADFALKDSQCKSSQCELTVSIGNLEQSDQLLEKMNKVFAANNQNIAIVIAADAQTGTSKLYISEDPKSFEFN